MFDKPLLQDDIWNTFLRANYFYLVSSLWALWLGIVLLIMGCVIFFLRKSLASATKYASAYETKVYVFDKTSKSHWVGFFLLLLTIGLTALWMFTLENSLFENFDLMSINTVQTIYFGLYANFHEFRLAPLSFWYLSSLYAITQNIYLIKLFVLAQLIIAVILLYYLFDYIKPVKRFLLLSLFWLSSTMLPTANIIFVERETIIALAASLIFAKKYCKTQKVSNFLGFMFFMIFSIYTKETCCLFFGGILVVSVLWNIWCENINLKSFLHPLKTIKTFPVEFLIALNLFLYATAYFILVNPKTSYASLNTFDVMELIFYYKFELFIGMVALAILCYSSYKLRDVPVNPLFRGSGFVCGGIVIALSIIFYLRLAPSSPHLYLKTYYLALTFLFALAYLFQQTDNKRVLAVLILGIGGYSMIQNIAFYQAEEGIYHRQVAEFLAQNMNKNEENIIYLAERRLERKNLSIFVFQAYSSAYRYYFKDYDITFKTKTSLSMPKFFIEKKPLARKMFFPMMPTKNLPKSGEWLILNKTADYPDIVNHLADTMPDFENKIFRVYHIK